MITTALLMLTTGKQLRSQKFYIFLLKMTLLVTKSSFNKQLSKNIPLKVRENFDPTIFSSKHRKLLLWTLGMQFRLQEKEIFRTPPQHRKTISTTNNFHSSFVKDFEFFQTF